MITIRTIEEIRNLGLNKENLFQELFLGGIAFDYALPQEWLDSISKFAKGKVGNVSYDMIRSTTVWVYPGSKPLSCCVEVVETIEAFNLWIQNG